MQGSVGNMWLFSDTTGVNTSYYCIETGVYIYIQVACLLRLLATCSLIMPASVYALMGGALSPLTLWLVQFRLVSENWTGICDGMA